MKAFFMKYFSLFTSHTFCRYEHPTIRLTGNKIAPTPTKMHHFDFRKQLFLSQGLF